MTERTTNRYFNRLKAISFILTIVTLLASSLVVFKLADGHITRQLGPELERKSMVVGETSAAPIVKALELGINYDTLRGVEEHFDDIMKSNSELLYIVLTDLNGKIKHIRGTQAQDIAANIQNHQLNIAQPSTTFGKFYNTKYPIALNDQTVGYMHLGVDHNIISRSIQDISYDALVVFLISLLVTFEVLIFILQHRVNAPIEDIIKILASAKKGHFDIPVPVKSNDEIGKFSHSYREMTRKINILYERVKGKMEIAEITDSTAAAAAKQSLKSIEDNYSFFADPRDLDKHSDDVRVNYIRTPLFIFVFAESLSISFLPLFSKLVYTPILGLPKEFVIAMPIIFFMLVYAMSQPFSGIWANIASKRKIFITGALISTVGLVGSGFAITVLDFLVWRMMTALGYGMILIACQGYILDNTNERSRNRGMAIYISGFYSATVCGAAIGSILADGIGYKLTFILSAVLALLSAGFVASYIVDYKSAQRRAKMSWSAIVTMLKNRTFMALVIGVSIPSKIILASVINYLTPLYLENIGTKQNEIGRIIMVYGFILLVLSPAVARLADKIQRPRMLIALGSLISGFAVLPVYLMQHMWGLVCSIILMGLGHAISMTAQVAIVPTIVTNESRKLGAALVTAIYRLFDISGFVVGPVIASFIVVKYDHITALAAIGAGVIVFSLLFLSLTRGKAGLKA